jgi:catalase
MAVQRTFLTARSVEFDAVLLAGGPPPAPDALPSRDAKAGQASPTGLDPRVTLLVDEAFRHAKVIGAWGAGVQGLTHAGYAADDVGVVTGEDASEVFAQVLELLGAHRVWDRFMVAVG